MKQSGTKRTKSKRNETGRIKTKRSQTYCKLGKQSGTNQNETKRDTTERNGTNQNVSKRYKTERNETNAGTHKTNNCGHRTNYRILVRGVSDFNFRNQYSTRRRLIHICVLEQVVVLHGFVVRVWRFSMGPLNCLAVVSTCASWDSLVWMCKFLIATSRAVPPVAVREIDRDVHAPQHLHGFPHCWIWSRNGA